MQDDLLPSPALAKSDVRLTLMESIILKRLVTACYNNAVIQLAPHQLFDRAGDLFLSALNLSKSWRSPDEQRLGQFKLAGLSEVVLLEEPFEPLPVYDGRTPRTEDVLVLAI